MGLVRSVVLWRMQHGPMSYKDPGLGIACIWPQAAVLKLKFRVAAFKATDMFCNHLT